VTVSWCCVWRSQSTKSKHPLKQPLWLKLVHTIGSKQGPREPVSSFRLTCLGWWQMVTPKPAEASFLAWSPLTIFQTCSAGIRENAGGDLTLIWLYWIDIRWKYAYAIQFVFFALSFRWFFERVQKFLFRCFRQLARVKIGHFYLKRPKLADNVPKMSRRCVVWIKLVKLIEKEVLVTQNAWKVEENGASKVDP